MDQYVSENEDLREQLKQQNDIIDSLMEMKSVLQTQIVLEKEIMKQNLMNKQSFVIKIDIGKLEEDDELEDSDNLLSDNICLQAENNCLQEILKQMNGDKDYLADNNIEKNEEPIFRNGDLRRMSFNSLIDERQIYEDVLEGNQ